ncbi:MAG: glycerophosphodiester phosphodiesterase family protein [Pseudolabrys sp.]
MRKLKWLTARPIAHRGLHDASAGVIENPGPAFSAALRHDYGIECDVQMSADGEAVVYHDDALGRLTEGSARLCDMSAAEIGKTRFKHGADRILTFGELCALVSGRTPLLIELKSRFDGDMRLAQRVAEVLSGYAEPAAVMSFDPAVIAHLRTIAPSLTRGMVAQRRYDDWPGLPAALAHSMAHFTHFPRTRPHFIAYAVRDLPALAPLALRAVLRLPLLTWTVRSDDERRRAARYADQIIFECWRP